MFCNKCGKEIQEGTRFCGGCGTPIRMESENIVQVDGTHVQSINTEKPQNEKEERLKRKDMIKKLVIFFTATVIIIAGILLVYKLYVIHAEKEAYEQEQQRLKTIERTLETLGGYNRSFGPNHLGTVNYSMALGDLEEALIEEYIDTYATSGYDGTKKEYNFASLANSYDDKYQDLITILLFGYDYLEKDDVDYFHKGQKVSESYLREEFINVLVNNGLSFNSFLINKKDREICNNMSLKIRLTEDGYIDIDQMHSELIDFVHSDRALVTLTTSLLENKATYEDITTDVQGSFTGSKVYFNELTTSGKLVFLYMMPQFLAQCPDEGQEKASILWNIFYQNLFQQIWQQMINDNIFVDVITY